MSRLVRLYPMAWRERYEAEFLGVLHDRPVDRRDAIDVVLGAVDAHLHPELIGAAHQPWTHRLPGLLATGAGLIWTWFFIHVLTAAPEDEWGGGIGFAVLLMFMAVPGDYLVAFGRRIGAVIVAIVAAMILGRILPWSAADGLLNLTAGVTAWLLVGAGMLTLVAIRAGIGPGLRWLLLAVAVLIPATVGIPILGGFGPGDRGGVAAMVVATLPYGLAWALVGVRMTVRGSATIQDTPPSPHATEVPAT
ncbi:MAG: hypothetical protein QOJ75_1656 [Chloroflexota bacterium]|nr:hypothetical protein [Chloroflexota bacterium]